MPSFGLFITLYDYDTLNLYLSRGIYGFLMPPEFGEPGSYSKHYAALADYACSREDTHVFFFLKRQIVYGGQIIGHEDFGSFYINGGYCPLGRVADADLVWDEGDRECYECTDQPGIFRVETRRGVNERCQPYLIRFEDNLGINGDGVSSDDLYFELGSFPYPLPSNSIQGMSFCTLSPGETDTLIQLIRDEGEHVSRESEEEVELIDEPTLFDPEYGISCVSEASTESHLEASVLANPELLPRELRPDGAALCRQVPISPFKPSQMDRADICYYSDDPIREGTVPNAIIELKNRKAGKGEILQVVRYVRWLKKVIPKDFDDISFYLFAPDYTGTVWNYVPREFQKYISLISFDGQQRLV